ncbi:Type IV secretion system protein VirD4 [Sphingobium yanoikuyae]|uniref:Type IV secretion system protein VirD4 n=1 Tax=Sphingobium yanoikuyae TaxID=13690 RepID=A0A084ENA7_SPHYA|nr:conjugal transfer protein TraG [Sphingobium yanoikuyae]KEZ19449.1 Type IV secretion system protein VirD4 [Sphingobium yanoikuyae]
MSATKILWGQVLAVIAIMLAGIWAATQWTAAVLAYQPELGQPWFWLGPWPIYPPPAFFWWWFAYDAYAPTIFETGAFIAVSGAMAAVVVAIAMSVWRAREEKKSETYGSARWATEKEIRKAGLYVDEGVVIGWHGKRYLRHDGPEHVLCFAPTRSGKGVGLVIPSLLTWPGSCIVHDIKGENWTLTAGFRAQHGRVLLFDPTNPLSNGYNPLLEVRKGEWEVRDVQNVADVLIDPEGSLEKRNHWEKTSHALLVGAILHVLYAEEDKTLAGVAAFLSDPRRPVEETLRRMKATRHLGEAGVHPVVAAAAQELLNKSDNERSGVLSTAMSFLGLYRDPVVAKVTGSSDWRIADLVSSPVPVSLYLVIPPSDISRTKPLVRLMLNQIGRRLTEELTVKGNRQRLLFMLDEFPALGRLDFFESALAFVAGYGIKTFLIAQSLNQIEKAYGQNNAILDNCHVRVAFAANDERTAKRVSDALGTATEQRSMKNYAGHRLAPWLGHVMVSRSETARPLLTPGEIQQFSEDEELVFVASTPPIRAAKARYYLDPRFKARLLPAPEPRPLPPDMRPRDDWTVLDPVEAPPMAEPAAPADEPAGKEKLAGGGAQDAPPDPAETDSADDAANAGIRQEPELGEHENIAPDPKPETNEFDFDRNDAQDEAAQQRREADRLMRRNARNASLDPDDGLLL